MSIFSLQTCADEFKREWFEYKYKWLKVMKQFDAVAELIKTVR